MRRWIGGFLAVGLLAIVVASLTPSSGIEAQDGTDDEQATAIADLQTRVAVLETVEAGGAADADQVQATQIADLQTRVAALETAIAGSPSAGTGEKVLFEANAQTGFDNWTDGYFGGFSNQFTVQNGILVAAEGGYTILYAPYLTTSPDYILEAEIRLLSPGPGTPEPSFGTIAGLAARYKDGGFGEEDEGYIATTWGTAATLEAEEVSTDLDRVGNLPGAGLPDPREGWHVYRFELRGDQLRFLIDGVLIAEATDARYSGFGEDGRVGVVASLGPLEVRSFRVLAWE